MDGVVVVVAAVAEALAADVGGAEAAYAFVVVVTHVRRMPKGSTLMTNSHSPLLTLQRRWSVRNTDISWRSLIAVVVVD